MALYLIGDVQGCDAPLQRLLQRLDFSASRDTLYLLGDLVNRGPDSLAVLRRLMHLGSSARCLLGNHDLHLLALAWGVHKAHPSDTLDALLQAPDRSVLLQWLRTRPVALREQLVGHEVLMVHAGVLPSWSADTTVALAAEVEAVLASDAPQTLLGAMYGNKPARWADALHGDKRLRAIVNVLTRMRFCTPDGAMDFETKEGAAAAPPGFQPWFDVPGRLTASITVAFGHWSTLGWLGRNDVLAMDTGCVWGGCLSAARLLPESARGAFAFELIQEPCTQARKPTSAAGLGL